MSAHFAHYFDLITALPSEISCTILSEWVDRKSVRCLDSAYCQRSARSKMLALLQSPEFTMQETLLDDVKWLVHRAIKVNAVKMIFDMDDLFYGTVQDDTTPFFTAFGKYVRWLDIGWNCSSLINLATEHCRNLTRLTISVFGSNPSFAELLRNNANLQNVAITSIACLQNVDISDIVLPSVHTLSLYHFNDTPSTFDVLDVFRMFPNVVKLNILGDHASNPSRILWPLAQQYSQLRALNLCTYEVDTAILAHLVQCCPRIVHLDLGSTCTITDDDMLLLASSLKLRSLAVPYNLALTDQSLQYFAEHCANTLTLLSFNHDINYSNNFDACGITPEGVCALQQRCPQMQFDWHSELFINYSMCDSLTLSTVVVLTTGITDTLLSEITCPYLRSLDLQQDENFTPEYTSSALRRLIERCVHLKSVWVSKNTYNTHLATLVQEFPLVVKASGCEPRYDALALSIE